MYCLPTVAKQELGPRLVQGPRYNRNLPLPVLAIQVNAGMWSVHVPSLASCEIGGGVCLTPYKMSVSVCSHFFGPMIFCQNPVMVSSS